jgi:diacylglycerol kinase family enzyme
MRVLLLVNATASSVTARERVMVRKLLSNRHEVEVAETSRRGHATRLALAAANDGFDVVAVFAGDGTLNEAAQGLIGTPTALAPLPGGSTNVYARTLGIPTNVAAATNRLLASLDRDTRKRIGVGSVEGRPFLFHTGIGFDAAVIRRVERYGELKRYASHPLHVLAAFETWFRHYDRSRPRFDLVFDDGARIERCYFAVVSKTTPYTYLGARPIHIAPDVGLDTRLAVTAFTSLEVTTLIGGAASAMRSGRFLRSRPDVHWRYDVGAVRVEAEPPVSYQVDGDDVGDASRLAITYCPDALTVIVP